MEGPVTDMDPTLGVYQHDACEWWSDQRRGQSLFRFVALQRHARHPWHMPMHPLNRTLAQEARSVVIDHRLVHGAKLTLSAP